MAENDSERTEQATPRRREKAREEGRISKSRDLSSIASVGGILVVFLMGGKSILGNLEGMLTRMLSLQYGKDPFTVLRAAAIDTMMIMLPFLFAALIFAVAVNAAQGGVALKPLELKLDGLNPLNGLKRYFSFNGLTEFLKSMVKFVVGGFMFYFVIKKEFWTLPSLMEKSIQDIAWLSGNLILKTIIYGFLCFLFIGITDFFLERLRFERSIRMSKQEIKDEFNESEGNPQIKAKIRGIQREMARKRMMQEVPKATVVITNPTHIAVCLKYDDKEMVAPKVIAKGADFMAEKIKEIARKNNIPLFEDRPLARVLFKLELDTEIPEELYKAVARILAYIYKLRRAS